MRSIDSSFYKSKAWKDCRRSYLEQHPLCEACLAEGKYTPAAHVHHKIWLNAVNVSDPSISLNHANLEALCHACHNAEHFKTAPPKRYSVDPDGKVITRPDAPL